MEPFDKTRDGSSPEKAVRVESVEQEYEWLRRCHPGFQLELQALTEFDGKPYDLLRCRNDEGETRSFYFDISEFFGR